MRSSPFALLDGWLAPAPPPARVAFLKGRRYAHRGRHDPGTRENSRAAFAAAIARGEGIELDVQASRDGEAFVFHDATLDRMTAAHGPLAARDGASLATVALSGSEETIPSLRDVLALVAGRAPLLVEIKTPDRVIAPLCRSVRAALDGYAGPVAVIAFNPEVVRWFARKAPHVVRGLSFTEEGRRRWRGRILRRLALWRARPDFLTYDVRDLPSAFAARQRARGLPVVSWTISTDADEAVAAATSDGVIHDRA